MSSGPETQRFWLLTATYASVGVAFFLIVIKSLAWFYTGSASLLGSLIDSLMDSLASIITMLAVSYSLKPADIEHRFGHGKAESIAGVVQSAFIVGSGAFLLLYCIDRLSSHQADHLSHTSTGIAVMVISTVLTLILVTVQRHAIKITNSTAVRADSLHYISDTFMNIAIIIALIAASYGWQKIDLIFGVLIALYIIYSAIMIAKEALSTLMDKELGPEVEKKITEIVCAHKDVLGFHELRTRQSGTAYIIQFHIEMDDSLTLFRAHEISDEVESGIKAVYPNADVIIHQDPASVVGKD